MWLDVLAGLMIGTILGGATVAAIMLHRRAKLDAQLANARAKAELLDEHLQIRAKDEDRLKQAFTALGAEALRANNEQFVELAKRTFETVVVETRGDAERRRQAVENLIKPINALLEKQNSAVGEIEKKREVAYRGLEEQIKAIAASHEKLGTETSRLVAALRRPEQRGRWGEMQLQNTVELAGMTAHCDFTSQPQTDDPETRDRPDMVVHIPGGGRIIVDAKVALDAYLEALEPGADHAALVQRHANQVVEHYRHLASKQYWNQFERTPKLVVMFMPLESAMTAALEVQPDLHAEAMKHHVLIATPTLLVAMLRAIAYGWQQEDVAANAQQIARVGDELYKRLSLFAKRFTRIGAGIDDAREAYNAAVGTLENRVLASTRELKRLHATTEAEIEPPRRLEVETRPITAAELKPPASGSEEAAPPLPLGEGGGHGG